MADDRTIDLDTFLGLSLCDDDCSTVLTARDGRWVIEDRFYHPAGAETEFLVEGDVGVARELGLGLAINREGRLYSFQSYDLPTFLHEPSDPIYVEETLDELGVLIIDGIAKRVQGPFTFDQLVAMTQRRPRISDGEVFRG